jgi:DNA-binding MarR family transcriptional regulator
MTDVQLQQVLEAIEAEGLTLQQLRLLMLASGKEQVTMSDLAHGMKYTTAACTGAVDTMEKQRFVKRQPNTEDRRKIFVHLTSRGAEALSSIQKSLSVN